MGFQARTRTPRDLGRRIGKNKPKANHGRREKGTGRRLEEEHAATLEEVAGRATNSLTRLGDQRFAIAPFHEHHARWLLNVRDVLSEFEADCALTIDNQFKEQRSQLLSNIEAILNDKRAKETSKDDAIRKLNHRLLESKSRLAQTDRQYTEKIREISGKRERTIKPVISNLGRLRKELDRIARMRAGFLRGISKKTKAEKTTLAAQKLDNTKEELAKIRESFDAEQDNLKGEYQHERQRILEEIEKYQKEIENLEARIQKDDSMDPRNATCKALVDALDSLIRRKQSTQEDPKDSLLPAIPESQSAE